MRQRSVVLVALLALTTPSWGSYGDHLASVHFHSAQPDFGIAPRRGRVWNREDDDRPGLYTYGLDQVRHQELSVERDEERAAKRLRALGKTQTLARVAVGKDDFVGARRLWEGFVARFGASGEVQDRLEVLAHPNPPAEPVR
uniref:hypothetical protein n=1 Tax=Armatimonas sp. TaxID=1872638 RepID=UPI00286CCAF3